MPLPADPRVLFWVDASLGFRLGLTRIWLYGQDEAVLQPIREARHSIRQFARAPPDVGALNRERLAASGDEQHLIDLRLFDFGYYASDTGPCPDPESCRLKYGLLFEELQEDGRLRSSALIIRGSRPSPRAWARSANRRDARL